ncbi:MAG: hypothetical protein HOQ43_10900 [Glycomyces artemisiae]|uniref:Uncharacterized protein n=1 Tax=Glycomyces artemisiae TaxID=1076443 RepID=A0A850C6Q7_9ACTN|nr:hypothetical protein [Glycomyces artemisiae]
MAVPAPFRQHSVVIEPRTGDGPYGPVYGPEVTVTGCWVEDKRQYVRDASGAEVLSESSVYTDPGVDCPPGSRVTLPTRVALAISTAHMDAGAGPLAPLAHVVIACT